MRMKILYPFACMILSKHVSFALLIKSVENSTVENPVLLPDMGNNQTSDANEPLLVMDSVFKMLSDTPAMVYVNEAANNTIVETVQEEFKYIHEASNSTDYYSEPVFNMYTDPQPTNSSAVEQVNGQEMYQSMVSENPPFVMANEYSPTFTYEEAPYMTHNDVDSNFTKEDLTEEEIKYVYSENSTLMASHKDGTNSSFLEQKEEQLLYMVSENPPYVMSYDDSSNLTAVKASEGEVKSMVSESPPFVLPYENGSNSSTKEGNVSSMMYEYPPGVVSQEQSIYVTKDSAFPEPPPKILPSGVINTPIIEPMVIVDSDFMNISQESPKTLASENSSSPTIEPIVVVDHVFKTLTDPPEAGISNFTNSKPVQGINNSSSPSSGTVTPNEEKVFMKGTETVSTGGEHSVATSGNLKRISEVFNQTMIENMVYAAVGNLKPKPLASKGDKVEMLDKKRPAWWNSVAARNPGEDLQRCSKRSDVPPRVGDTCAKIGKVCYFGSKPCDIGPYPTVRCECTDKKWSCIATVCP